MFNAFEMKKGFLIKSSFLVVLDVLKFFSVICIAIKIEAESFPNVLEVTAKSPYGPILSRLDS